MSDPFVGEIRIFAFPWAPYQWAQCNGQVMSISQNQALFALIGTYYGGNGTSTFQLPNLQSRLPMHIGQGLGLSAVQIGEMNGVEQTSILISNMPAHTHTATFTPTGGGTAPTVTVQASTAAGSAPAAAGNYLASTAKGIAGVGGGDMYVNSPSPSTLVNIGGVSATGGSTGGGTVTNAISGQGLPLQIRNPYLGLNFCISLFGMFPTRN